MDARDITMVAAYLNITDNHIEAQVRIGISYRRASKFAVAELSAKYTARH